MKEHSIEEWLAFFLRSVAEQLNQTQKIIEEIYTLYDKIRKENVNIKSPYIIPFIDMLFVSPIFSIKMVQEHTKCASYITATSLIKNLEKQGYVSEVGKKTKNKLFGFNQLLKILK